MLKKSKGNRFHQQGFIFSTFPINFIICLTPYRKASITGAFFIKESEDNMGVRVVFPDMGKDPSVQLIEKTITENGTYDAITDGANGYSKVNVNVEGGGGESDFSTAEVEFKNQTTTPLTIPCCCIIGNNIQVPPFPLGATSTRTYTVVLYKGSQQLEIPFGVELTTVTGDITVDSEEGIITINGSGTVLFQP